MKRKNAKGPTGTRISPSKQRRGSAGILESSESYGLGRKGDYPSWLVSPSATKTERERAAARIPTCDD